MFERWRPPIIPSATTAESNDSTAPRSAIVNAGPISAFTCSNERCGTDGCGIAAESAPKRLPTVSTGNLSSTAIAVVTTSATNGAGIFRMNFGQMIRIAIASADIPVASGVIDAALSAYAPHLARNSGGTAVMRRPNRSLICPEKMISAIPLVKPVTTGKGMNLMTLPSLKSPNPTRIAPAMSVATVRPSTPNFCTMP
jgi:hypothetical protein